MTEWFPLLIIQHLDMCIQFCTVHSTSKAEIIRSPSVCCLWDRAEVSENDEVWGGSRLSEDDGVGMGAC